MSDETPRTVEPRDFVPELPDLDQIRASAEQHVAHWTERKSALLTALDHADAEIKRGQDILDRMDGKPTRREHASPVEEIRKCVGDETYKSILTALGNRSYAGIVTLVNSTGFYSTTVGAAMQMAEDRGHARFEIRRGRKRRYYITDAGVEFLTAGAVQLLESPAPPDYRDDA